MRSKLTAILLLLGCVSLNAETQEKLSEHFTAKAGGKVVVEVGFGAVKVTAGKGDEVTVEVTRKVSFGSKDVERKFLESQPVVISQEENIVTVESKGKPRNGWSWTGRKKTTAEYVITVPAEFDTDIKTNGGAVRIEGLTGTTKAQTSGGQMEFKELRGPLDGRTAGGRINVDDCEGELNVRTSGGSITLAKGRGSFNGHTSGGRIELDSFHGSVDVDTSGGGIEIEAVDGSIKASTSGGGIEAVVASGDLEPIDLRTSGGNITLRLPVGAAYDIDASTSGGRVTTEFSEPAQDKKKTNKLVGPVNGGGPSVRLHTSGGGIRVRKL